jgi:hypothetical protein
MRNAVLGATWVLGIAGAAGAQTQPPAATGWAFPQSSFPGYPAANPAYLNPANVMPNIFNPQVQPLSPYLNLFRGGNPGVNYYYGVRPGTVGGAGSFGSAAAVSQGGARRQFVPQLIAPGGEPVELPEPGEGYVVPPAGHPVVYNNTLGYFPTPFGMRGGMTGRPGVAGAGAGAGAGGSRPTTPRR